MLDYFYLLIKLMLCVITETPEEVIHDLKSYFLINNVFILKDEADVDNNVDLWFEQFDGVQIPGTTKSKFGFPFIVATSQGSIITDILAPSFEFRLLNEIPNIVEISPLLISMGFLPLDATIIKHFAANHINQTLLPKEQVIAFFHELGYLDDARKATDKLVSTLLNNQETERYANLLLIIASNKELNTSDNRYIDFMFEVLKFIDINVHSAILDTPIDTDDILIDEPI